ncbi:winged helix-turn-helix domain-containing protein [Actinoplanes sp. CA-142083]|uniref:winged helix-turn-helix domain-containing protein n=1 Tax=Actinoplanes sp. CA-142083 TaxID=3239903 RepID=UPI003D8FB549
MITEPETLRALAHPVRLALLTYLMANSPATATQCAAAVDDTPSNCSYHLRTLAKIGLVEPVASADGRERPWRALVTGLALPTDVDPRSAAGRHATLVTAMMTQRDQQLTRRHLERRDRLDRRWRNAEQFHTYTLRASPDELRDLGEQIDALLRPFITATRSTAPDDAAQVHFGFHGFPVTTDDGRPL